MLSLVSGHWDTKCVHQIWETNSCSLQLTSQSSRLTLTSLQVGSIDLYDFHPDSGTTGKIVVRNLPERYFLGITLHSQDSLNANATGMSVSEARAALTFSVLPVELS